MTTTAAPAMTLESMRGEVTQLEARITQFKENIIESEAEASLLAIQQRRANAAELPAILRKKEIVEAGIERDRSLLTDETDHAAILWAKIRKQEEDERYQARIAAPEKLKVETLKAISNYREAIARLSPQATAIQGGLAGLRRIVDSAPMGTFPIAPEALAAQSALRETHEAIRGLREMIDAVLR